MIDVSIIIVNYNVKDYLLQCLRSLYEIDTSIRKEIIVVDNNSSDGSVAFLRQQFQEVHWIELNENIGYGKANNLGLAQAQGRYTLFLNPDTIVGRDVLQTMTSFLDADADVGIAGCKVLNPDGSFQVACRRGLPTPWASFCKLFGLQSIFPNSRLFAQYNMTYLPIDATYPVDALIGAFMMGPTAQMQELGGFDPAFFMYGEDIDLCYRVQLAGRRVMYVHTTNIIHYKGESTKRSSMNEVRVFYDAMEIFAKKHFGGSQLFLAFLRLGIVARSIMARLQRKKRELFVWLADMIAVNGVLLFATSVRFQSPFGFPEYAYPIVPIALTIISTLSLISVGEYVEYRPTMRRSAVGLLVTFFMLSSLTYFFKDFGFSRGVLLMTIGFSVVMFALTRGIAALTDRASAARTRRVLLVGINESTAKIIDELDRAERRGTEIVGVVATQPFSDQTFSGSPILGEASYLSRILDVTGAQEVILTDQDMPREKAMELMIACSAFRARFHLAHDYDDIVTARIINDVAGEEPTVSVPPLLRFRNRVAKRIVDVIVSTVVLTLGLPVLILRSKKRHQWWNVFQGSASLVGLVPDGYSRSSGKPGLTGLAQVSRNTNLSVSTIQQLNDYYVQEYTLALDVEIILKQLFRRSRA
ncbi:MAG: glycosyltransferase [Ignavibacteria bacterium]|nr:glycosyltransferase [Ignavibacteria bacterium]